MTEEGVKGGFHAVVGIGVGILWGHNVFQFFTKRERRYLVNMAIYTFGVGWELKQAHHHWSKPR